MNLIPPSGKTTGNYWCTWRTQSTVLANEELRRSSVNLRNRIDDEFLFGNPGTLAKYFDRIREDLYVVLDDGWDVPYDANPNNSENIFGSLEVNEAKFPSLHGDPPERLRQLCERVKALGYRGLGLWIACQMPKDNEKLPTALDKNKHHWQKCAEWCNSAGISYWKVDWGKYAGSVDYRKMMTEIVRSYAPLLSIEHSYCQGAYDAPYTERIRDTARANKLAAIASCSDYIRAYDVVPEFRYTTMFGRTAEILNACRSSCIINIEDAVQIGASLGCSLGIMRHQLEETRVGGPQTLVTPINDAERYLKWQRIAPPFAIDSSDFEISDIIVTDKWEYPISEAEQWPYLGGKKLEQSAPLAISRGLPLPSVSGSEILPLTACSKNPANGAVSVGTFPRTLNQTLNRYYRADIAVPQIPADVPIGIFGRYKSLKLTFDCSVDGRRIMAQDLCSDSAVDITSKVECCGQSLTLSGELIDRIGLAAAKDLEDETPGIVMKLL